MIRPEWCSVCVGNAICRVLFLGPLNYLGPSICTWPLIPSPAARFFKHWIASHTSRMRRANHLSNRWVRAVLAASAWNFLNFPHFAVENCWALDSKKQNATLHAKLDQLTCTKSQKRDSNDHLILASNFYFLCFGMTLFFGWDSGILFSKLKWSTVAFFFSVWMWSIQIFSRVLYRSHPSLRVNARNLREDSHTAEASETGMELKLIKKLTSQIFTNKNSASHLWSMNVLPKNTFLFWCPRGERDQDIGDFKLTRWVYAHFSFGFEAAFQWPCVVFFLAGFVTCFF